MSATAEAIKPLTHKQRIMLLLASGRWVHQRELNAICFRYGARLYDLRKSGFDHEWEKRTDGVWYRIKK